MLGTASSSVVLARAKEEEEVGIRETLRREMETRLRSLRFYGNVQILCQRVFDCDGASAIEVYVRCKV